MGVAYDKTTLQQERMIVDTASLGQLLYIREKQSVPYSPSQDRFSRTLVIQGKDGNWVWVPLEGQEPGALVVKEMWEYGIPRQPTHKRAEDEKRLIEIELGRRQNEADKAENKLSDDDVVEKYSQYIQDYLEAVRKRANGENVPLPVLVFDTQGESNMEIERRPQIVSSTANAEATEATTVAESIARDEPIDHDFIKRGGFSDEELATLSDAELRAVQRSVKNGLAVNSTFKRSNYFPLPRDLSFPAEKPFFIRWAADKTSIVEIGVFEGASAVIFRRAMSPNGTLHLIDPYIVVPDSGLTARPWMAKLNLMRSHNGTVKWHQDHSDNVASEWNQPIDLLFIDGDHSYRGTRSDWDKWHSHVVAGGIVMFHDARMGKPNTDEWDGWPGPTRVVDELFRGDNKLPNWDIVEETGSLVVVQRVARNTAIRSTTSNLDIREFGAVIFDNDGIVLDSEPINFEAARLVFEKYGVQLLPQDVQEGIGAGSKYMSDPMTKYSLSGTTVEQLMKEREARFRELASGRLAPFPGLHDLVGYLGKFGVRTAVASSATTEVVMTNFGIAGLEPNTFNIIVDSSVIKHKKPAPDIFLQAAKDLDVPPSQCLVIEDSIAGIEAAKRAGMKVVAVASSFPKERLSDADYVVTDLKELLALIKAGRQQ
ncbi:MAG: hypothetical protein COV45_03685 [Deltaproteobacteria bacterium CG11_big_fil_rev_8_21_14_0_20_47_16]|nr:MAG: hypothetical protein COV45_03685 [Deltaproteobacteria bacterium CG11_big_fil_rev_8_21_14_0_20_47_16]